MDTICFDMFCKITFSAFPFTPAWRRKKRCHLRLLGARQGPLPGPHEVNLNFLQSVSASAARSVCSRVLS